MSIMDGEDVAGEFDKILQEIKCPICLDIMQVTVTKVTHRSRGDSS